MRQGTPSCSMQEITSGQKELWDDNSIWVSLRLPKVDCYDLEAAKLEASSMRKLTSPTHLGKQALVFCRGREQTEK